LQCAAACCSVLECVVVCWSVLQSGAVWCSLVQSGAVWCSLVQSGAVCCSVLQCVAVCGNADNTRNILRTHIQVRTCSILQTHMCVHLCTYTRVHTNTDTPRQSQCARTYALTYVRLPLYKHITTCTHAYRHTPTTPMAQGAVLYA